jgi:hypothetical protein
MAISYVASTSAAAANGSDATLTLSGLGLQQNDLVIVAYGIGDNDNVDFNMAMVSAGWTEIADLFANDTQDANLGVYWKIMPATPDTSAVVDGQGGTDAAVSAVMMAFRGVDPTNPFDVASTTATGIDSGNADPPSIDHNNPSGVWTVIAAATGHTGGATATYTFPTGYTTNAVQRSADDTSDVTVGLGYRTNPSDPEDPAAFTHSQVSTNNAWCAVTMALRPDTAQTVAVGKASETETASTVGVVATRLVAVGKASEIETARTIAPFKYPYTETFGQLDWPFPPWTETHISDGTATVTGGVGALNANDTGDRARVYSLEVGSDGGINLIWRCARESTDARWLMGIMVGTPGWSASPENPLNSYQINVETANGQLELSKNVGGSWTNLGSWGTAPGTSWYWYRLEWVWPNLLHAKQWSGALGDEPSTWGIEVTDSDLYGDIFRAYLSMYDATNTPTSVYVDDFYIARVTGQTVAVSKASETETAKAIGIQLSVIKASEIESAKNVLTTQAKLAQVGLEVLLQHPSPDAKLSHAGIEVLSQELNPAAWLTQAGIEVLHSRDFFVTASVTSETETARPIGAVAVRSVAVGVASETEIATPIGAVATRSVAVGVASETESAKSVGVSASKLVAVNATVENEAVKAIGIKLWLGKAQETEVAQSITVFAPQSVAVGRASETETARTVTTASEIAIPIVKATETETARTVTAVPGTVSVTVDKVTEAENTQSAGIALSVAKVAETETAITTAAIPGSVSVSVTKVSEAETARGASIGLAVSKSVESETAQSVGLHLSVTKVTETETSRSIGIGLSVQKTSETEVSRTVSPVLQGSPQTQTVNKTTESEIARSVSTITAQFISVVKANEIEQVFSSGIALGVQKGIESEVSRSAGANYTVVVNRVAETEVARTVDITAGGVDVPVNLVVEVEVAWGVLPILQGAPQTRAVNVAVETEIAREVGWVGITSASVTKAIEAEVATSVGYESHINVYVTPVYEVETAKVVQISGALPDFWMTDARVLDSGRRSADVDSGLRSGIVTSGKRSAGIVRKGS